MTISAGTTHAKPQTVSCHDGVLHEPQAVLAAASQAYISVDTSGRVVGWNPAAETTFGHTREQACGQPVDELIIPQRYQSAFRAGLVRLAAGEFARILGPRLQLFAAHPDGHEFPIEMTLTATDEPAGRILHAFAHDITTRYRASRFTDVEAAVSRGLAEAASSTDAAARLVQALGMKMHWPVTELWLADETRQVLSCTARHAARGYRLGRFAVDEVEPGTWLPGRVYAQAQPQWIPDLAADTRSVRSRAAARIGLHVAVGVPVCSGGHTLGALCVYGDRAEDPEDVLIALLAGVAAQVGQYLERRRAEELTVELARTKDEFLALVTHELRNPLAVITSTTSLFEEELDTLTPDDQREYLATISRSAQRLSVMAEDLLDLARLESGHLAIQPAATDLCGIIRDAIAALRRSADDKSLTIAADLPDHLTLDADPDRLRQVADNLLSNAVKYTPAEGRITVAATAEGDEISWTVADTGIGIPPDERSRLFRRFYRASTALDRRIPGTGLGLVIIRTIIERHHGTITVADTDGPGTTFVIHLPAKAPTCPC
ncbi:ATP-binding protein [Actinoplanes sp. NPDC051859]|uniref:sensor histidine kinase n=1 Tax=Actinoplanes sp. NPDC051859 TaxID=3363909 RepID=UPI0037A3DABF